MQITTNLASLDAQRSYLRSSQALELSEQRLSSGQRINSASDDAAGLAISSRLSAQVAGLNRAAQNVNDGISLLQVADGALDQITSNFQRIRTLAVQAGNSSYNDNDRQALQQEADALTASSLDIARQTQFNQLTLLDGSYRTQLQVGANDGDNIAVDIPAVFQPATSGTVSVQVPEQQVNISGQVGGALAVGALSLNGKAVGASLAGASPGQSNGSAYAIAAAINAANVRGVSASASTTISATLGGGGSVPNGGISINGVAIGGFTGLTASALASDAANSINGASGTSGVSASASGSTLTLTASDGRNINLSQNGGGYAGAIGFGVGNHSGTVNVTDAASGSVHNLLIGGTNPGAAGFSAGAHLSSDTGNTVTILRSTASGGEPPIDLSSTAGATDALTYIDGKIDSISQIHAYLGATENRLEQAHSSALAGAANLSEARSRIVDTDYASETAQLTRTKILQQAATSIVAQANTGPRLALQLLR